MLDVHSWSHHAVPKIWKIPKSFGIGVDLAEIIQIIGLSVIGQK